MGLRGAAILGNPGVAAMVEHHALLYADLADPVALLRGTRAADIRAYWPYVDADRPAGLGAEAVDRYTSLMSASQALIAEDVLAAYSFDRHRTLLDVGGGDGTFLSAAAARFPGHLGIQVETAAEVQAARERFAAAGLAIVDEGDTVCCFARQDKVWVHDPDGNAWEIYVLTDDMLAEGDENSAAGAPVHFVPEAPNAAATARAAVCCEG